MKRVLVVQPSLAPPGGGNAVAAWMIQALREDADLTLLTWSPVDLAAVDRYYGTSLGGGRLRIHEVPAALRRALDAVPASLSLMKLGVLRRALLRLDGATRFDVLISANNELDFGRRGIQYVHFPRQTLPRPSADLRWYHRPPGAVRAYRSLADLLARSSPERVRGNLTLANSAFIAGRIRESHGVEARVVYPPVAGDFPTVPWEERSDGFVCVGRFSPEKELEKVIGVAAALRERGRDVRLHLVGDAGATGRYARRIRDRARREPWIRLHADLPRPRVAELVARQRYGLHGMVGEHFGIAVAEQQRAGCIPFAPALGGPSEILGGDRRILYRSPRDAVEKIERVLGDAALCAELRAAAAKRAERFTTQRFVEEIRRVVAEFRPEPSPIGPGPSAGGPGVRAGRWRPKPEG